MYLTCDVGNSNIVLEIIDSDMNIVKSARIATEKDKDCSFYIDAIEDALIGSDVKSLSNLKPAMCSVVPELDKAIFDSLEEVSGIKAFVCNSSVQSEVKIAIENPDTLGADLYVGAVAACSLYGGNTLIFDLGTASTCTYTDKDKIYRGGMFIVGLITSIDYLSSKASKLPKVSLKAPDKFLCTKTEDALNAGAIFGTAAMIDGLVKSFVEEEKIAPTVVLTGGVSACVKDFVKTAHKFEPHLLSKGMKIMLDANNN